jgi:putative tryptophan/tyrosine transport system substrate-binding protein
MILDLRFWILDWGRARMKAIASARVSDCYSDNRKSKTCPEPCRRIQNLKWLGLSVFAVVLVVGGDSVEAQQETPRIGFVSNTSPSAVATRVEAFRKGLRELGYVEGKDIVVEYRHSEGKLDRLPALVAELVSVKVDIIVTSGPSVTRAAKDTTSKIPIVFAQEGDPVGSGLVASLARPGGNITGLSTFSPELHGKRLEILKEVIPRLARVAVLRTSTVEGHALFLKQQEPAARALRLQLQYLDLLNSRDIEPAFRAANKGKADALLLLSGPVLNAHVRKVVDLAAKSRLPAIYNFPEFVDAGGLMTYGVSQSDLSRRAATYVDKILKGANPGDLPVEQPAKFELVINLKAAKQIGLTIPPNVLARADRVIR